MVRDSLCEDGECLKDDPTRGMSLVVLSVATSIDAFAVGLGLGLLNAPVVEASVVIGIVAASMTFLGLRLGKPVGNVLGRRMETVGGIVLIAIGLKIIIERAFA